MQVVGGQRRFIVRRRCPNRDGNYESPRGADTFDRELISSLCPERPMQITPVTLTGPERQFLRLAAEYLERPTFLMKTATLVGKPAEAVISALPDRAQAMIAQATNQALASALDWAVRSLPDAPAVAGRPVSDRERGGLWSGRLHTALAATTGAVGGFFGLAGLALELPATTTVMLRSIARIAAQHGADLHDPLVRLQCLAVFSFGSPTLETMESAYFTGRLGLAWAVRDAATFVGQHTAREISEAVTKGTAPVLVKLVNQIAGRFQVVVTQKVAAQAVPLAGAATGALINAAFSDHFNTVARYHFGIVELERKHGQEAIRAAYLEARLARVE
jgi:uncharacterized protein (DUF697 family)